MPDYLVSDAMAHDIDPALFPGPVKVADFGLAFFSEDPEPKMSSGGPYIVPEFNAPGHCGQAADIWMLGCAIYQLLSGYDIMGVISDPPAVVVREMMKLLGAPPDYMLESWNAFMGKENIQSIEEPSCPLASRVRRIRDGNVEKGMKERKKDYSEKDVALLTSFLGGMLRFEPSERLTITQVLDHPGMDFFRNTDAD